MAMAVLQGIDANEIAGLLRRWRRAVPEFHVMAFLPEGEAAKLPGLQDACRQSGVALAGAVFPQLVVGTEMLDHGVILLRVAAAPPPCLIESVGSGDAVGRVADEAIRYVEGALADDADASMFCLFDALVPNIATHLDAWYLKLADRVRYFGVNAGNERFQPAPCLFDGQRFIDNGVLLQLLPGHPGACLEHGYAVPEHAITATSARGNSIVQIDWRPALDVYRDTMRQQYGVAIDRENFYANAVHFPFGILRADGEVLVRIPVALGEHGEIVCVGEIQPNAVLTLLDARDAADRAAAALARGLTALGARQGDDLVLFYCAGRRLHMGNGLGDELRSVAAESGAKRVAGALSLGEIGSASSGGYPLFHNATLVGIPWPEQ
jgi:hypothetical protein